MDSKINIRIDEDTKFKLEELALESNLSLSEYLREFLNDHVDDYYEEESNHENLGTVLIDICPKENLIDFKQSTEFTYLLIWLFAKYLEPVETNDKHFVQDLKARIEKVISSSSFSVELKMEFVKVLNDINRFLVEPDYDDKKFNFCIPSRIESFNYWTLINEVLSLNK